MIFTLEISLAFNDFGWCTLQDQAHADGLELDQLIDLACSYYESQLGSDRTAMRVPRFERSAGGRENRVLQLEIGAETRRLLAQVAFRQGVALVRLLAHAAMFYLADLDTGRVTEQIVRLTGH